MARPTLCVVTAATMSLEFFWAPLLRRAQDDFDITVIANGASAETIEHMGIRARAIDVDIARRPAPLADLRSQRELESIFRRERFDLVHSQTPKAGMLAMSAARRAGVPARFHTFTGQVWATRRGPWRWLLRAFDQRIARNATALLADSRSQAEFLVRQGVVGANRISVLHHGSIAGVDAARFRPDADVRRELRRTHAVADDDTVVLFVGRLHREKGIAELIDAFAKLVRERPTLRLWLVGPDEGGLSMLASLAPAVRSAIVVAGATRTPERFMAAADVLVLPSHREGFGSVVIEAAACGVPCVASRINGLTDAVVDGTTGLLHELHSADDLERQLARLIDDSALRTRMSRAALDRARSDFAPEQIAEELVAFYRRDARAPREGRVP